MEALVVLREQQAVLFADSRYWVQAEAELAAAVQVPVATSSLMQVPWVQATLPPALTAATTRGRPETYPATVYHALELPRGTIKAAAPMRRWRTRCRWPSGWPSR